MSTAALDQGASTASSAGRRATVTILYLGLLGGIQSADPNINSTALLKASTDLKMGTTAALAASIATLFLAATAITTGMMGDRLGRRRVLVAALIVSAAGDLIVMASPDTAFFLLGRILAGIGLGAVFGAGFAFLKDFATGKGGLGAALGVYMGASGLAALLIVFTGSSLVGVSWRIAFLVVPVLCVLCIPAALALLPGKQKTAADVGGQPPWDLKGQLLLGLAIIFFLVGVSHASDSILAPLTWGGVIVGIGLFAAFYIVEKKEGERGFFPVRLLKEPIFIAAILCGLVYNLTYGTTLLSFTNLFQYANKLSGLELSVSQLPFLIAGILAAVVTGKLRGAGKISRGMTVLAGATIASIGFVLFAITASGRPSSVLAFIPALVLSGAGIMVSSIPYGGMIIQEADPKHFGAVASSRLTIGQFWFSLGLAGSTVIVDSITRGKVQEKLGATAGEALKKYSVSGTKPSNPEILRDATLAYSDAFAVMMLVLAAVTMIAGIASFVIIRKARRGEEKDTLPPAPPSMGVTAPHLKPEHLGATNTATPTTGATAAASPP